MGVGLKDLMVRGRCVSQLGEIRGRRAKWKLRAPHSLCVCYRGERESACLSWGEGRPRVLGSSCSVEDCGEGTPGRGKKIKGEAFFLPVVGGIAKMGQREGNGW